MAVTATQNKTFFFWLQKNGRTTKRYRHTLSKDTSIKIDHIAREKSLHKSITWNSRRYFNLFSLPSINDAHTFLGLLTKFHETKKKEKLIESYEHLIAVGRQFGLSMKSKYKKKILKRTHALKHAIIKSTKFNCNFLRTAMETMLANNVKFRDEIKMQWIRSNWTEIIHFASNLPFDGSHAYVDLQQKFMYEEILAQTAKSTFFLLLFAFNQYGTDESNVCCGELVLSLMTHTQQYHRAWNGLRYANIMSRQHNHRNMRPPLFEIIIILCNERARRWPREVAKEWRRKGGRDKARLLL